MRAAVLTDDGAIDVQERERPKPNGDEVIVEIGACSVCMTDYHMYHGTFAVEKPLVLGHESAGTVAEVGDAVSEFSVGDRVAVNPTVNCQSCSYCKRGDTHLCENGTSIGGAADTVLDGAFAEYVRVPASNVAEIGDLSFEHAALAEPLACCIHGVNQVDLDQADSVAIIGAGPIGLMLMQTFRNRGASPIVVSEPDDDRRKLAAELGADAVVNPDEENPVRAIRAAAGGGVDVGVEAIGLAPTIQQANEVTAPGGTTLIFGVPDQETTIEISPFDIFYNEIGYRGSFSLTTGEFERAVTMLQTDRIDADALITEHIALEELPSAFERMGNADGLKKVVHPGSTE